MPGVIAVPEGMTSAATDLATIVSNLSAAHAVAALPTSAVLSAAEDEVSTVVAHVFSQYARDYRALAGQATAFHDQFVQHLSASATGPAGAEASNVASLQPLNVIAGAVGGLPGQAIDLFHAVRSRLLDSLTTIRGALVAALTPAVMLLALILIIAIILTGALVIQLLDGAGFTYLLGVL
jgi:hypothetical protein